jgi:predicted O-methyltransferase YrrM
MFERIHWEQSQLSVGDVVFDLMEPADDAEIPRRPRLLKDRALVLDYERVFDARTLTSDSRMLEMGLADGASAIFWAELFDPAFYVGVDIAPGPRSDWLDDYVARRGLAERLVTIWGVDQADGAALRTIVAEHRAAPLDVIIDDASHLYDESKASFEALFPLVRDGGIYVIEDWAWEHWPAYESPDHRWAFEESPTRLALELIEMTGTNRELITRVDVLGGLLAVHRGPAAIDEPFSLSRSIQRRQRPGVTRRAMVRARRKARAAINACRATR